MSSSCQSLQWETNYARQRKTEKGSSNSPSGTLEAATKIIDKNCPSQLIKKKESSREIGQFALSTRRGDLVGLDLLAAKVNGRVASGSAYAKMSPTGASAQARAVGPEFRANAILLEGVLEANSKVVSAEVGISAGGTLENLGAKAEASATLGKAAIGIKHTPLQAHFQGPSASAEAGLSWDYAGLNIGISGAEVKAGPFAVRAGVKFGGGIRNGVPEIDLGLVTVPVLPTMCSIIIRVYNCTVISYRFKSHV